MQLTGSYAIDRFAKNYLINFQRLVPFIANLNASFTLSQQKLEKLSNLQNDIILADPGATMQYKSKWMQKMLMASLGKEYIVCGATQKGGGRGDKAENPICKPTDSRQLTFLHLT